MQRPIEFIVLRKDGAIVGYERIMDGQWQKSSTSDFEYHIKGVYETVQDNLIRLQFTGLTDKNGAKIWEGDCIKRPSSNGTAEQMAYGTVLYDLGCFYVHFDGRTKHDTTCKLSFHSAECEVIGNIHDPETCKSEKE